MRTLSCSDLPLFTRCNAAIRARGIRIQAISGEAEQGTTVHDLLAEYGTKGISTGIGHMAGPEDMADPEVRRLFRNAAEMLDGIAPTAVGQWVAEAMVWRPIYHKPDWNLRGHIDLYMGPPGQPCTVVDNKAGRRKDADYRAQLRGYCLCLLPLDPQDPGPREFHCWILYDDDKTAEHWVETEETLLKFKAEIVNRLVRKIAFTPGPHCEAHYCPMRQTCPARGIAIAMAARYIGGDLSIEAAVGAMEPGALPGLWEKCRAVSKLADAAMEAIKTRVRDSGGTISGPEYLLRLPPDVNVESIDPLAGWPILERLKLTEEDFRQIVTINKSKAIEAVRAKAPRGEKQTAEQHFLYDLHAGGAIVRKTRAAALQLERRQDE